MSLDRLAEAIIVPPLCVFTIGDDAEQTFAGWFLGFWNPDYANVCVDSETMAKLRLLDLGDDFETAERREDGRWYLVGGWSIRLVSLDVTPTEAATLLNAALATN